MPCVGTVGEAFRGFYSHYGHSYAGSSEQDAAHGLISELEGLEQAAAEIEGMSTVQVVLFGFGT